MTNLPPAAVPAPNSPEKAPGLSIASLICGIFSIIGGVILFIPAVLAIVFGHVSLAKCNREKIRAGRGMSIAGLVLGYLSLAAIPVMGLLAAMAIPAFQKVRTASQEKAMLNNVRMLSAAADQYCLESGKAEAKYSDLVGPDKFVKHIMIVAGEKYPDTFVQGEPIKIITANGRVMTYDPKTGQMTGTTIRFER